jgi:hypothetical protein
MKNKKNTAYSRKPINFMNILFGCINNNITVKNIQNIHNPSIVNNSLFILHKVFVFFEILYNSKVIIDKNITILLNKALTGEVGDDHLINTDNGKRKIII